MISVNAIAAKGYQYYLTLKILKAVCCPFWVVIFTGIIALYMIIYPVLLGLIGLKECIKELPVIYKYYILDKHWFTNFSFEFYDRLYNPNRQPRPISGPMRKD